MQIQQHWSLDDWTKHFHWDKAHLWATYEFHMSNLMKFAITSLESYITEPLNFTINIDFTLIHSLQTTSIESMATKHRAAYLIFCFSSSQLQDLKACSMNHLVNKWIGGQLKRYKNLKGICQHSLRLLTCILLVPAVTKEIQKPPQKRQNFEKQSIPK